MSVPLGASGAVTVRCTGHGPPETPRNHVTNLRPATRRSVEENVLGAPPPWTPEVKDVRTQGVSVRATRKPTLKARKTGLLVTRSAERRYLGTLPQWPPRSIRRPQSPDSHALPSDGAPL